LYTPSVVGSIAAGRARRRRRPVAGGRHLVARVFLHGCKRHVLCSSSAACPSSSRSSLRAASPVGRQSP